MPFTPCDVATNNISVLDDLPNDVGGLTAEELKAAFDKFGADFVAWFNATHKPELDAHEESASTETKSSHVRLATTAETTAGTSVTTAVHPKGLKTELDKKLNKTGGTMTGPLIAQNNANYTTAQTRNVILSTADPSGGGNGDIWIKYAP